MRTPIVSPPPRRRPGILRRTRSPMTWHPGPRPRSDSSSWADHVLPEVALEARTGDPLVGLDVAGARPGHDLGWERRAGRGLVPRLGLQPVAHELLVEARLGVAGCIRPGIPEARGIGCEYLVDEHQAIELLRDGVVVEAHGAPATFLLFRGCQAELELRVGKQDPASRRDRG